MDHQVRKQQQNMKKMLEIFGDLFTNGFFEISNTLPCRVGNPALDVKVIPYAVIRVCG